MAPHGATSVAPAPSRSLSSRTLQCPQFMNGGFSSDRWTPQHQELKQGASSHSKGYFYQARPTFIGIKTHMTRTCKDLRLSVMFWQLALARCRQQVQSSCYVLCFSKPNPFNNLSKPKKLCCSVKPPPPKKKKNTKYAIYCIAYISPQKLARSRTWGGRLGALRL